MAIRCINCGAARAERDGDLLSCSACGHAWTVEDEARMAGYIRRALRREPLVPSGEMPQMDAQPEDVELITEPAPTKPDPRYLSTLRKDELRQLADDHGVEISSGWTKAQIIDAMDAYMDDMEF
jgi:hypothetical protein